MRNTGVASYTGLGLSKHVCDKNLQLNFAKAPHLPGKNLDNQCPGEENSVVLNYLMPQRQLSPDDG